MLKKVLAAGMVAMMVLSAGTGALTVCAEEEVAVVTPDKTREELKVGVSFKTLQEERWVAELNVIQEVCEENGVECIYQVSENDAQKQVGQIENLVEQGIDILIFNSNEKEAVSNAAKAAHDAGVLVCYYEKPNGEVYCDICGGNDEYEIGTLITKAAADAGVSGKAAFIYGDPAGGTGVYNFHDGMHDSLKECDLEIVGEQWTTNWDPSTAMGYAENWISQYGEDLSAIFCMNDGMAGGVVQALDNAGLAGKVIVTGQDCDLLAVQRVLAGTQISTILKSGKEYPRLLTETCIAYRLGEMTDDDFPATSPDSEGIEKPFMVYPGTIITKDNVDDVIEAGVYTHEEVYGEAE